MAASPDSATHDCEWRGKAEALEEKLHVVEGQLSSLKQQLDTLMRRTLGPKSEKMPPVGKERPGGFLVCSSSSFAAFDEAYVRESIVAPMAKMVRGYTLQMPAYDGLLDEPRLAALTHYVLTLPAPIDAQDAGEARVEVDPVCHMQVRVEADSPHADFDGGTYFFCCEHCRDRLVKAPEVFLAK